MPPIEAYIRLAEYDKLMRKNNKRLSSILSTFGNKNGKYKTRLFSNNKIDNVKNALYIANKIPKRNYIKLGLGFNTIVKRANESQLRKSAANVIKGRWKSMFYVNPKANIGSSQLGPLARRVITSRIHRAELMNELKQAIKHRNKNDIKNIRRNNIKNFRNLRKISFGNGLYMMAHSSNGKTQYKYYPNQEKLVVTGPNFNVRTHTKVPANFLK